MTEKVDNRKNTVLGQLIKNFGASDFGIYPNNDEIVNIEIDGTICFTKKCIDQLEGQISVLKELKNTRAMSFIDWFEKHRFPGCRYGNDELRKSDSLYFHTEKNILYFDESASYKDVSMNYDVLVPVVKLAAKKFGVEIRYHRNKNDR